MKHLLATAAMIVVTGGLGHSAVAQNTSPQANPHPSTPAIAGAGTNNQGAPAVGANSFTEAQAKSRIEKAGYANVSGLVKDKDGIWRGRANNGSATVPVALDYQGNVVPAK
jgi:negative regulator of sigma E activity